MTLHQIRAKIVHSGYPIIIQIKVFISPYQTFCWYLSPTQGMFSWRVIWEKKNTSAFWLIIEIIFKLASVAQLDGRPTCDQEVAGLTLLGWHILSWKFDHEIFSMFVLSLPLIQEGQLSFSDERMCTILVSHLEN